MLSTSRIIRDIRFFEKDNLVTITFLMKEVLTEDGFKYLVSCSFCTGQYMLIKLFDESKDADSFMDALLGTRIQERDIEVEDNLSKFVRGIINDNQKS